MTCQTPVCRSALVTPVSEEFLDFLGEQIAYDSDTIVLQSQLHHSQGVAGVMSQCMVIKNSQQMAPSTDVKHWVS
jgi:hypothetical protein